MKANALNSALKLEITCLVWPKLGDPRHSWLPHTRKYQIDKPRISFVLNTPQLLPKRNTCGNKLCYGCKPMMFARVKTWWVRLLYYTFFLLPPRRIIKRINCADFKKVINPVYTKTNFDALDNAPNLSEPNISQTCDCRFLMSWLIGHPSTLQTPTTMCHQGSQWVILTIIMWHSRMNIMPHTCVGSSC